MSKIVYIVLTKTDTLLSRTIQFYTNERFTHVSIAFDRGLREMYSFGRKKMNNPFIGGFVHENPTSQILYHSSCAVYACSVTEEQYYLLRKQIQHYQLNKRNYKYNFIGLFGVACRFKIRRTNAFFCSQFIATLLAEAGLSLEGQSSWFIKPTDFMKLPYLKLSYIGDMKHYHDLCGSSKTIETISTTVVQHIA